MAASAAFPPACRIAAPASLARRWLDATIPRRGGVAEARPAEPAVGSPTPRGPQDAKIPAPAAPSMKSRRVVAIGRECDRPGSLARPHAAATIARLEKARLNQGLLPRDQVRTETV